MIEVRKRPGPTAGAGSVPSSTKRVELSSASSAMSRAITSAAVEVGRPQGADRRPGLVRRAADRAHRVGGRVGRHDLGVRAGARAGRPGTGRWRGGATARASSARARARSRRSGGGAPAGSPRPRIQSAPSAAASWSRVWLTEPSIEFSIGTSASGPRPRAPPGSTRPPSGRAPASSSRRRPALEQRLLGEGARAARGSRPSRRHAGGPARPSSSPVARTSSGGGGAAASRLARRRRRAAEGERHGPLLLGRQPLLGRALHHLLQVHAGVVAGVERGDDRAGLVAVEQGDRPRLAARPCRGRRRSAPCPGSAAMCAGSPRSPRPGARPGSRGRAGPPRAAPGPAAARPGGRPAPPTSPSGSSTCWAARSAAQRDPEGHAEHQRDQPRRPRRPPPPRRSTSIRW